MRINLGNLRRHLRRVEKKSEEYWINNNFKNFDKNTII